MSEKEKFNDQSKRDDIEEEILQIEAKRIIAKIKRSRVTFGLADKKVRPSPPTITCM